MKWHVHFWVKVRIIHPISIFLMSWGWEYYWKRRWIYESLAAIMFGKFEKYWAELSTIMTIATILDPLYKFNFSDWAFKRIYGVDHMVELSLLKDKLFFLFAEYSKNAKGSCSAADISSSNCKAANIERVSNPLMQVCCFKKENH